LPDGDTLALGPPVKPVAMVADAIRDCSARGDLVLDPFLGSGTTLIAAERTGRICRGVELDPRKLDTAVRRWQAFTADFAYRVADGRSFNELEEEARSEQREGL
jgi:DNA modification methylase